MVSHYLEESCKMYLTACLPYITSYIICQSIRLPVTPLDLKITSNEKRRDGSSPELTVRVNEGARARARSPSFFLS